MTDRPIAGQPLDDPIAVAGLLLGMAHLGGPPCRSACSQLMTGNTRRIRLCNDRESWMLPHASLWLMDQSRSLRFPLRYHRSPFSTDMRNVPHRKPKRTTIHRPDPIDSIGQERLAWSLLHAFHGPKMLLPFANTRLIVVRVLSDILKNTLSDAFPLEALQGHLDGFALM